MIWCVEDDSGIRDIEMYALTSAGFDVRGFEDAFSLLEALKTECPDLIILDVMLPEMDGVEILKKLKSSSEYADIPIIMATAKGHEYDKVISLDLGADDYLVKPFSMLELTSRVKAVLRRCNQKQPAKLFQVGGLVVNLDEHTVFADDERVQLTYKEFELLRMFLSHPGMAYTREQLFTGVWNFDYIGDSRTLDMHIRTLRQKLGKYGKMIETVRNVGYRCEVENVK